MKKLIYSIIIGVIIILVEPISGDTSKPLDVNSLSLVLTQ